MPEINKTSLILGLIWVGGSYVLIRTVLIDWLYTMPIAVIPIILLLPVLLIKILFDHILKYDYFNKDYKKNKDHENK